MTVVASGIGTVELRPYEGKIIGERLNPTGKRLLKEAYTKGDTAYVLREAVKQLDAGAEILDINCGVPGLDEATLLDATVGEVQGVANCPLQIDTADAKALERALRHVNGKALVNSVNGKQESMGVVFPIVKKYGGVIVALCLDENGIPNSAEGRVAIAKKILEEGAKYGFTKDDFVVDALTLAVSTDSKAAMVTLETVKRLTEEVGVNTVLGISNVSFGLPNRVALNNTMYALAKKAGLSVAIVNPAVIKDEIDIDAEAVLMGRDVNCEKWIAKNNGGTSLAQRPVTHNGEVVSLVALSAVIERGLKVDSRQLATELIKANEPLTLVNESIVPALERVGKGFETGKIFLPQLLMAADAAGEAFEVVKNAMGSNRVSAKVKSSQRPIVIATVKGDIHDIGKNIVRALLENYGFEVIDLGRDVAPEKIVETAQNTNAFIVGLSALMTTTTAAMAETIRQLKAAGLSLKTIVGGAVITQEYANTIGADYYGKDAMATVRIAQKENKQ